jgi:hypothetical protein
MNLSHRHSRGWGLIWEIFMALRHFYDILINCGLKSHYLQQAALSQSITRMIIQGFVPPLWIKVLFMAKHFAPATF